jgi:hypothetical protein
MSSMPDVDPAPPAAVSRPPRRWALFVAGVLLFFLGPAIYAVQLHFKRLEVPWHAPLLATAGLALMIASVWRSRGVVRMVLLALFTVVCGFEWFSLLVGMASPAYTGPAQPGREIPEFTATFADGTPFTEKDLAQGQSTIVLFFRGRW